MANMPAYETQDAETIVKALGWFRIASDHGQYKHSVLPGKVTISHHNNKDALPPKTFESIMTQAGLKDEYDMVSAGQVSGKGGPVKTLKKLAKERAVKLGLV